ncbi:MAG TPA: hypothetical protein PKC03_08910 [Dokdonella sp.]|nr:hypothetical protein [Dokdonella sp.]
MHEITQSAAAARRNRAYARQRRGMQALLAALLLPAAGMVSAQVAFNIAFDASANVLTATEKNNVVSHLQEAGRRWTSALAITGPRSIEITVFISNIPTASGASAITSYVGTINGRDTYEQGVAAELRLGTDPNGAAGDAIVTFGLAYLRNELWFDPDPQARTAPVPLDRTDAMSTVLHELGHILAYNGFADVNTGQPPATFWSIWDRWMIPGQPTVFSGPNAVASWGSMPDLTTGNINHLGNPVSATAGYALEPCTEQAIRWRDGAPIPRRCPAPGSIDAPPSAAAPQRDSRTGGASLIDQLMNGVVFYRGTRYDISDLDRGVLRDVGFTLDRILATGFDPP